MGPAPMIRIDLRSVRLGIRHVLRLAQGRGDGQDDAVHILQHVIAPETQRAVAVRGEPRVAHGIARAVGVLTAIEFDDELGFEAREVRNVRSDRTLLAEISAADLSTAQIHPKAFFYICQLRSQVTRTLQGLRSGAVLVGWVFIARRKTRESLPPPQPSPNLGEGIRIFSLPRYGGGLGRGKPRLAVRLLAHHHFLSSIFSTKRWKR